MVENGVLMAGGTDLVGALRAYAQKALGNDFNPEKAAAALNSWVKESGDVLKDRIERETERAVKKLGLAKESEIEKLRAEIAALRAELGLKSAPRAQSKTRKSSKASKSRKASALSEKKSSRSSGATKRVRKASKKSAAPKKSNRSGGGK